MRSLIVTLKNNISISIVSLFNLFPIKNNKVFIFSYYGSQYGCSPKYISQYLVENYPKDKFDIVWAFNDVEANKNISGIRVVKTMSLRYFYDLCTSKVIITNFRTTDLFKKRKDQYYIQTWHSSLRLKQIEKDAEESLPKSYIEQAKKDSPKCDLLLSGCKFSTDIFKRAFWYNGEIFEHGTPRNDMLLKNNMEQRNKVKDILKVDKNKKIILYAPTFRKGNNLDVYDIDYSRILDVLKDKFGGEWVFLVKLHPHLISKSKELVYGENVLDVTSYGDIQDLLNIVVESIDENVFLAIDLTDLRDIFNKESAISYSYEEFAHDTDIDSIVKALVEETYATEGEATKKKAILFYELEKELIENELMFINDINMKVSEMIGDTYDILFSFNSVEDNDKKLKISLITR